MKTILIIEDDTATLKGLTETLQQENYIVISTVKLALKKQKMKK